MTLQLEDFVSKTLKLLEKERDAEIEETRILQENVSSKELQRRGVCLLKLRVGSRHTGLFGRNVIVFEPYWPAGSTGDKALPSHSFTPGDIAGISLSSSEGPSSTLASGVVSRVTPSSVSIAIDDDDLDLEDDEKYKLLKLANDVTYKRLKRALNQLNNYRSGPAASLINALFGVSKLGPPYTEGRDKNKALPDLVFQNEGLDDSQREAVRFALHQRELAIVHGPPGTGKTTTIVEIVTQAVRQKLKVLACAPSNIAVDNLVERLAAANCKVVRLGHPARVLHGIQKHSLDAILSSSDETKLVEDVRRDMDKSLGKLKKTRDKGSRQQIRDEMKHLKKELRERESAATKSILQRADVVLATLTGASIDGPLKHLGAEHFDLVVIDECSQSLEAACWLALMHGPRCILAGDHLQLPPTILSHEAAKEGLEVTLMERLIKQHGDLAVRMLTTQYRMHHDIMAWASQQLYESKLVAHHSVAKHLLKDLSGVTNNELTNTALLLVDTTGCNLSELDVPDEVSKGNEGEADLVAYHVEKLIESGLSASEIAVIAPYNLQVDLIRLRLSQKHPTLEIRSVDGFQGREKEAVIISMVRSNTKGVVGFLAEDRRINVAITRARRHLAVICDTETISHHPFLKSLVEYMTQHGDVRSAQSFIDDGVIQHETSLPDHITSQMHDVKQKLQKSKSAAKKAKPQRNTQKTNEDTKVAEKRVSEAQIADDQSREEELREELVAFSIDASQQEHAFPSSLSAKDRYMVHEIAERLCLLHVSEGIGENRHIIVRKPQNTAPQKPTSTNTQHKDSFGNQISSETRKPTNDNKQGRNHNNSKSKNKNTDHVEPSCKNMLGTQDAENEELATPDVARCGVCEKFVPTTNLELHRLRCKPAPTVNPDVRPKSKKKKAAKGKTEKVEEDFDALIEAAIKENSTCPFKKCKEYTTCLGQECAFCGKRFCLKHHIPEVHGCGGKAKVAARITISREGVLHRGSGVPDKSIDPARRAYLERKMEKKIGDMEEKRKIKKKEKE